jgi:hypothetical protein
MDCGGGGVGVRTRHGNKMDRRESAALLGRNCYFVGRRRPIPVQEDGQIRNYECNQKNTQKVCLIIGPTLTKSHAKKINYLISHHHDPKGSYIQIAPEAGQTALAAMNT